MVRVSVGVVATWMLLAVIWGSTWLFIKVGLADLPPFTFAAARFLLAPLPLFAVLAARRTRLPRDAGAWRFLATTGFLTISLSYGLVFWGERFISSGLTAILFTTLPLWGLVFAHLLVPAEPMTGRKLLGVVVGILGVALIFGDQIGVRDSAAVLGVLAVLLAAVASALGNVLVKARGGHLDPMVLAAGQMSLGAVPLLAAGILLEGRPSSLSWTARALTSLLFLALIGSALAFALFYWLIHRIEVTKAQLLPFANTLIAVILGSFVLREALGWRAYIGGAAILAGLAVCVPPGVARARASPTAFKRTVE